MLIPLFKNNRDSDRAMLNDITDNTDSSRVGQLRRIRAINPVKKQQVNKMTNGKRG